MISLIVDDPKFIGIFTAILVVFIVTPFLIKFRKKIPLIKKYYTQYRLNSILFIFGCILGLVICSMNGWTIFDESSTSNMWMKNILYFLSGTNGFILTIMFLWFACMLPIRYFSNLCMFTSYKEPFKKFVKLSLFYALFATIAIGISTIQYGLKEPFFLYESSFSNNKQELNISTHPFYYVMGQYFLANVLRNQWYTVIFMSIIIFICIVEFIVIKYIKKHNYNRLVAIVKKMDKIAEWSKFIDYTTPITLFVSATLSLSIHPVAASLHLSLLLMMLIMLTIVVVGLNSMYTWINGSANIKQYKKLIKISITESWKGKDVIESFCNIKDKKICKHLDLIGKEQDTYNIFATIIYSIVITGFLGFVNGPLLKSDDSITHLLFWLSLFFVGYLLMFAYSFKYTNIVASKLMMSTGTLDVITTFNTGILNFFNPIIYRLATITSIITLYSIAFKHAKYDNKKNSKKIIHKNKK